MIPLKDINPSRSFPIVNLAIILICSVVWLYEVSLEEYEFNDFIYNFGLVPVEVFSKPYQLFTHMFLHGSWLHIIGNMWFLWVFGDNVEDRLGKFKYLLFYVLSGLGAAVVQSLVSFLTGGVDVPMVDALTKGLVKKIEEEKINYLNSLLERAKEKGWKAELVVKKHSNTVDGIVEFVKEGDYDLLVMGGRGLSGLKRVLLGSTSSQVLRRVEVPILIHKGMPS